MHERCECFDVNCSVTVYSHKAQVNHTEIVGIGAGIGEWVGYPTVCVCVCQAAVASVDSCSSHHPAMCLYSNVLPVVLPDSVNVQDCVGFLSAVIPGSFLQVEVNLWDTMTKT